jgi:hypothetical protein
VKEERVKKLVLGVVLTVCSLATAVSCGSNTTTGHPVSLRTQVMADPEIDRAFNTETGWSVRVEKAAVSLAALYYFDGEPAFVLRTRPLLEQFAALFRPSIAHAHPGHYIAGSALGQMTRSFALELGSEPSALPEGIGVTGLYRSARVVLGPADNGDSAALADDVATLTGTAEKDGVTVHFQLSASLADVTRSVSKGAVNGCVFDESEVEHDGTVTLSIKPHIWLNLVDFTEVESGNP